MKSLLKMVSVIAFFGTVGLTGGVIQSHYKKWDVGYPGPKSNGPLRKPIFNFADAPCVPTDEAHYISVDAPLFSVHRTSESYSLTRPTVFVLKTVEQSGDQLTAHVYTDGQYATVPIPLKHLWAVRFCHTYCDSELITSPQALSSWGETVSPCARQNRETKARLIFGAAFLEIQEGHVDAAARLFEHGLHLDPNSAEAWFYFAEAEAANASPDPRLYQIAMEIGLPADLKLLAQERVAQ